MLKSKLAMSSNFITQIRSYATLTDSFVEEVIMKSIKKANNSRKSLTPSVSDMERGGGDQLPKKKRVIKKVKKKVSLKTTASAPSAKQTQVKRKKKRKAPPKLKDVLCRSLLVTSKSKRPQTVPFTEMNRDDKYVLRGKFLPKGCHILEDKIPPDLRQQIVPEDFFVTPASHRKKKICLAGCRYEVLSAVATELGYELVGENDLWNINWSDCALAQEKIMQMRRVQDMYSVFWGLSAPLQKTNHFPGMYEICRKDRLGRNLKRLRRIFPNDYNFFPETWDLPTEQSELISYSRRKKNATFIIKPESGCQGKGIFLMKDVKKLRPFAKCVCQVYVPHPFLIDGYKFDQRIYVLITCVDPLRLYIYDEGIARFATVKYEVPTEENLEVIYMHLTNYSLNKFSESYVREGDGSKRKLSSIYSWMSENGFDVIRLMKSIDDIVVKTILCAAPTLKHNYKTSFPKKDRGCSCFELLGFDILIDRHLNPLLLEVNHSPSFNLDLPVDTEVKSELLKDLLNMVYLGSELCPNPQQTASSSKDESLLPTPTVASLDLTSSLSRLKKKKKKRKMKSLRNSDDNMPFALSSPCVDDDFNLEITPALRRQFKHEMNNRGKFRLLYSSDKPGEYLRLMYETNTNYNGIAAVSMLPDQQVKKRLAPPVIFEPDPLDEWQVQRTSSILKMTRNGQMYLETRLVHTTNSKEPSASTVSSKKSQKSKHSHSHTRDGEADQKSVDPGKTKSKSKPSTAFKSKSKVKRERSRSPKRSSKFRSKWKS